MKRSATFSEDRSRRYELIRDWRDEIKAFISPDDSMAPDRTVLFVMLNPSTADEERDDPTVRKVVGFAKRWGFGRAVIVNLLPIVSADPWELPHWSGIDMKNRAIIQGWMGRADMIVVAWGSHPKAICRKIFFPNLVYLFRQIAPVKMHCIGLTKRGDPLHPSRAPYTTSPEVWDGEC